MAARTIPDLIREIQAQNGWDQTDVAEAIGRSTTAVSDYLNRKRRPGAATCQALARISGYDVNDVMRMAKLIVDDKEAAEPTLVTQHLLDEIERLFADHGPAAYRPLLSSIRVVREALEARGDGGSPPPAPRGG